jgi:hypothetical protein
MAEPKIKTIQARFGFADPDIMKAEHNDMIKWLDANIEDVLMLVLSRPKRRKVTHVKWEPLVRMAKDGGQFIGFADLAAWEGDEAPPVLFEAKTRIESLGELFRQLSMYRGGYYGGWPVWKLPFVVVCPDDSEAEIIQEQRYHFLKYDPGMTFAAGGV